MKVLVIAPHPDDEVLGVGGTIHRLASDGGDVTVAIVTKGWEPLFPESQVKQVRAEAKSANESLGVRSLRFLDLPVTRLNTIPEHELNATFEKLLADVQPEWVFVPFPADRHEDHRQVFDACQVAMRPTAGLACVTRVLSYETVSETHWATPRVEPSFEPQFYVDVTNHLEAKLRAMRCYASQIKPAPDARSLKAVSALATWRGSVMGMNAAEGFMVLRECWDAT